MRTVIVHRFSLVPAVLLLVAGTPSNAGVFVSEVSYNPLDREDLEFVELANGGAAPVDLLGWSLVSGVRYTFDSSAVLPPGGVLVVARDAQALVAAHPVDGSLIHGEYDGTLDNDGEKLTLVDGAGSVVESFRFDDKFPFPSAADGNGAALCRTCPDAPAGAPFNWVGLAPSPGAHLRESECPPAPPLVDPERFPVVINEIHYHPRGDPDPELEFIELLHRGESPTDLSGWELDRGLSFRFPPGTDLRPGELLVVAQNPAELISRYDLDAARVLGPFAEGSRLSNSGETLRLVDAAGRPQDEVDYRDSGLWPVFADGLGGTLERVDPLGPSRAPGNWRVTPPPDETESGSDWTTFQVVGRHAGPRFYLYLLGAGELLFDAASMVLEANDATDLFTNADFDEGSDGWRGTGNHEGSQHSTTAGFGDDGPCFRVRASAGGNGFQNGVRHTLSIRPSDDDRLVLTIRVKPVSGESRFIARSSLARGNDDLLYIEGDARTGRANAFGSPLEPNAVGGPGTPPTLDLVDVSPRRPTSSDRVRIVARVDAAGVESVTTSYRIADGPGRELEMRDDGSAPDAVSGDGLWSTEIPPTADGSLVWFSLRARTTGGLVTLWPRWKNPSSVTGYQVVDDLPDSNSDLRLFHIFTPGALRDLSCNEGIYQQGAFVDHRGRAYHDVGVKFRGETACFYPKKPIRVRFNRGDELDGQSHLNFNAGWNDKSMLREKFGFELFRRAGVAYSQTHLARVHTNNGRFQGVYFTVEDPTDGYLRRNRRDDGGGLYKSRSAMLNSSTSRYEPRSERAREKLPEIGDFAAALNRLNGEALIEFLDVRLDVEAFIDYQAVQAIIIDGDSVVKNWLLFYGRHEYGPAGPDLVTAFPWDIDLSHGQMLLTTDVRHYNIHPLFQTRTYPFHDQGYHGIINALLERAPDNHYVKAFYGRIWRLLEEKFRPAVLLDEVDRFDESTIEAVREDLRIWPRSFGTRTGDPDYWRNDFRQFVSRRTSFLGNFLSNSNVTTRGRRFRYDPPAVLKFTEIHYNPADDEDMEFLEITNLASTAVDVGGWDIPLIGFEFPEATVIEPDGVVLVARLPDVLRLRPGFDGLEIHGPYLSRLPNDGGLLRLRDDGEDGQYHPETIDVVVYEDGGRWPREADGHGSSLELVGAALDNDVASSWRAGWSPGTADDSNGTPNAVIEATRPPGRSPTTMLLSGLRSRDPDGDELEYEWSLPGQQTESRPGFLIDFPEPGNYRVSLTVRDPFGASDEAELDITVDDSDVHRFRRGDANDDRVLNVSDPVAILDHLFTGGAAPPCLDAADVNDDRGVDIADATFALSFLFLGGPPPPDPGPHECGEDPTQDELDTCDPAADCAS